MERYSSFNVIVFLDNGKKIKDKVLAFSIYHACNRALAKYYTQQPNILKYKAYPPSITC